MAGKRKRKKWKLQDKMALLIFTLMSATVVFCVVFVVSSMVQTATNSVPLDITFEEYEKEELALDSSTENIPYKETENPEVDTTENSSGRVTASEKEESRTQKKNKKEKNPYDRTDRVKIPKTTYPYLVRVNRLKNCVTVYTMDKKGRYKVPVKAMICSVGVNNNTPLGVFQTSSKYTWRELYGNVYGQYAYRIHNAIMFHSVPYFSKNKNDLETEEYNKLGEAASLGCVRLSVKDAKWLVQNCPRGTTVEIYEDEDPGPLGRPEAVKIDPEDEYAGWDPTDPDKNNPW